MNFPQTLAIAQLCPSQGGAAVYTARFFVSLLNDSIEYDDQWVCLQQGILRINNQTQINESDIKLEIKPNPSGDFTNIYLIRVGNEKYNLTVIDIRGKVILSELNHTENNITLNTKNIVNGIYIVNITFESGKIIQEKLITIH